MGKNSKPACYAVLRGRTTGIFYSWPETEAQVKGFQGGHQRGFTSESEARAWLHSQGWTDAAAAHAQQPQPHHWHAYAQSSQAARSAHFASAGVQHSSPSASSSSTSSSYPASPASVSAAAPPEVQLTPSQVGPGYKVPRTFKMAMEEPGGEEGAAPAPAPAPPPAPTTRGGRVSAELSPDGAAALVVIPFDMKDIFKDRVPGREWVPASKAWRVPRASFGPLRLFLDEVGGRASPRLRTALEAAGDKAQITVEIQLEPDSPRAIVNWTPFSRALVNLVKRVSPDLRSWVPEQKHWTVAIAGMPSLAEHLLEGGCSPFLDGSAEVFHPFVVFAGEVERALEAAAAASTVAVDDGDDDDDGGAAPAAPPLALPAPAPAAPLPPPPRPAPAPAPAFYAPPVPPPLPLRSEGAAYRPPNPPPPKRARVDPHRPAPPVERPRCPDCRLDLKPRHACRFFGFFECQGCRHRWSSGYVWRTEGQYEKQDCRRCDHYGLPDEETVRPLERGLGGPGGPHDSERCHRCQRGLFCTPAAFGDMPHEASRISHLLSRRHY
eukprot:tig00021348_g20568.t1